MIWPIEEPKNDVDTIPTYAKGTPQRENLLKEIERIKQAPLEIPLIIDGKEVRTSDVMDIRCPHRKDLVLAKAHLAGEKELRLAIESCLAARQAWSEMDWYHRLAIFKRAAATLAGPSRTRNTAAIMLNQSKNPYEAEIDLAEQVDFWNFNAYFARALFEKQPDQFPGEYNRTDWRPLEGFVVAITPFNFYSIGGNLPTAPAMVGNVALWKPASSTVFSNWEIMRILMDSGIPPGVINFVPFRSKFATVLLEHPELAGVHFTGSYDTLTKIWGEIGRNLKKYKNFPRVVGETGGKDFIFVHKSANIENVVNQIIRGAFGYQGQKCSACSRVYVPESKWEGIKQRLLQELPKVKIGPVETFDNFMGAIIDESAYKNIVEYIEHAKKNNDEIVYGGKYDPSTGWFVEPTVILTKDPKGKLISEEIFGPVLTVYKYPDADFEKTLRLCDSTSPYALTGSIMADDRYAVAAAERILRYSAGNFYINDKCTGAIVGRQPFGGSRASGTNDKAGSWLNIMRWLNPRTIKENLVPVKDWRLPFMR